MKNVLLPTDLTVQSLRAVHHIVKDAGGEPINIHVVHPISLPGSIQDLLFVRQGKPFHAVPDNFSEALQLLRNKYQGSVASIVFDFIYSGSSRYFNNLLDGYKIDAVYMIAGYNYRQPLPQSENIIPYLSKCKVPVYRLPLQAEEFSTFQNLSALLNGNDQIKVKPAISYS